MLGPQDIPATWYVQVFVWIVRLLRKIGADRVIRDYRSRFILGFVTKLHLESAHQIRTFSIHKYFLGAIDNSLKPYEPFENLANALRNTLLEMIELPSQRLHCTIKICNSIEDLPKSQWKVYTIARSLPYRGREEFGPSVYHLIGSNSSFAPLVGCNDRKNTWLPLVYSCFACNNLTKHSERYDNSRDNWSNFYRSTIVFPLRYRENHEIKIIGFLTFDSNQIGAFGNIPDIFDYKDNPSAYEEKLSYSSVYHIGGIFADTLATTFHLQEKINY